MFKLLSCLFVLLGAPQAMDYLNLDDVSVEERHQKLNEISMPHEIVNALFQGTKDVVDTLNSAKIGYTAAYGTLLDIGRHTTMIDNKRVSGIKKHDDDVDLAIDVKDAQKLWKLEPIFNGLGYKLLYQADLSRFIVEAMERVPVTLNDGTIIDYLNFVDIFVFQEDLEQDRYILSEECARDLPFLKNGWFTRYEFHHRKIYNFGSFELTAPQYLADFLQRAYGKNCLTEARFTSNHVSPDHTLPYRWTLTEEEKIPALPSISLENRFFAYTQTDPYHDYQKKLYWEAFYAKNTLLKDPSSFAKFVMGHCVQPGEKLLEIGCGNGRDSFSFAQNGLVVTAIDMSEVAIALNSQKSEMIGETAPVFKVVNIQSKEDLSSLVGFDHIYHRFFAHALRPEERKSLMVFFENQPQGTVIHSEFRTDKDPLLQKSERISDTEGFADGHYRCFIPYDQYIQEMIGINYEILYGLESDDLSVFVKGDYVDNPVLARIVAIKR